MTSESDFFDADMGVIWVQPSGPNTIVYPLLCHSTDGIEEPQGDVTSRLCRTTTGWKVTSRAQGTPGEATFSIEAYLAKTRGWLQKQAEKRCPIPIYIHMNRCGTSETFLDYDFGQLGKNAVITSKAKTGMVRGFADAGDGAADGTKATYELSAEPGAPEYWPLTITRRPIAAIDLLNDIAFDGWARCSGTCGPAVDMCTNGNIAPARTGAVTADVWKTSNGAATWAAAAADPFPASQDTMTVVRFPMDRDTTRILVGCGTAVAAGWRVAYSDNDGATWTVVALNAVITTCFSHGGGLFALDKSHIWACSNDGLIYFSNDGGVTWTNQSAPGPTPLEALNCIRFADDNFGMAVGGTTGASSVLLTTTDGGVHWTLGAAGLAQQAMGVSVLDGTRAWMCYDNGTLRYTNDFGATWTTRTLPVAAVKLGDVKFYDEFMGAVCGHKAGGNGFGIVYRTFNGGMDWEPYPYTIAFTGAVTRCGLNALWVCDYNRIMAVGEVVGTTGLVLDLAP